MIKKIVMLVIIAFAGYNCWVAATNGLDLNLGFFELKVPSYESVADEMDELNTNVDKLNKMNTGEVPTALNSVTNQAKNYETRKQEYDLLALTASKEDIAEANKVERYLLDFLWMRIGKYASDNDIKWKMDYDDTAVLDFNITGSYISVINFIYDLENDKELNFNIEGIVIEGGSSDSIVKANFVVEGINVITAPEE